MKGALLKPYAIPERICKSVVMNYFLVKELLRNHHITPPPLVADILRRKSRGRYIIPAGNCTFSPRMLPERPRKSRCIRHFIYVRTLFFDVGSERPPPSFRFGETAGASTGRGELRLPTMPSDSLAMLMAIAHSRPRRWPGWASRRAAGFAQEVKFGIYMLYSVL